MSNASSVLAEYEAKRETLGRAVAATLDEQNTYTAVLIAAGIGVVGLLVTAFTSHVLPLWTAVLPLPVLVYAVNALAKRKQRYWRLDRLQSFYARGVSRMQGEWVGTGATGDELAPRHHPYAADLGLFGEGSLFELLCLARTGIGKRSLAAMLLEMPTRAQILDRQTTVGELRSRSSVRDAVRLLGSFTYDECEAESFEKWLAAPRVSIPVLPVTAMVVVALLLTVAALLHWVDWSVVLSWLAVQGFVGLSYRDRVLPVLAAVQPLAADIPIIREGVELMLKEPFESESLQALRKRVMAASQELRRMERMLSMLEQRNKEWFYMPSLGLMAATQIAGLIESWRRRNGIALKEWIEAWGEFEALESVACYAHEHPEDPLPEIAESGPVYEAEQLCHPLLAAGVAVANDVVLNQEHQFAVVSGSNMAGKSTYLRAVGVNAVLAAIGAPVRARRLVLSPFRLCASIQVLDSLLASKSRFLQEVERLAEMVRLAASGEAVLFLVDEIFSGTNSHDRRIAAEAVIRALVGNRAIGLLSTHDLALTEIAARPGLGGRNVHFSEPAGAAALAFDYRLHAGVVQHSNALAIVKMMGIEVDEKA